ncbi:MAG: plasma-membrane proton-efflux P-type ATPase [Candidatus Bathyarchaeota archaeon]|nr:plasma-membrane proton-efflux P-type ATPase [Candidatus Bathyarchaeota archaeon]
MNLGNEQTKKQSNLVVTTDVETGLSEQEAALRLKQHGPNEIPEKKVSAIRKLVGYFWGPIPWMIEIAAVLSIIIQHYEDFAIILTLLIVNAVVGFWQEKKADNAIEFLKKRLAPKARVLRDSKWSEVPSKELVLGDIVRVRLGDIVPADIKLMRGDYLLVDESALTGESLPVEKHISDIAYSGAIVRQGEMDALVVATGVSSYYGKTTKLVAETRSGSHFQKAVIRIGNYLIILAAIMVTAVFIAALFRHADPLQILQFALVLVVASIPVALPAVLTVTMAIGAIALTKREAIVSKLVSIEEMAGVDVLFSDKTGTITKNELTVAEAQVFGNFAIDDVLLYGALASREEDHDPLDDAVIAKVKIIHEVADVLPRYNITEFKPFDPVSKRTEATVDSRGGARFKVSKGAPQVVLALASNNQEIADKVNEVINKFASKGHRALGVIKQDKEGKWQFVGLLAIYDPPREDSAETIKTAQKMGLNVKMVTGDHIAIAKEIAQEVNLGTNIVPASSFVDKQDSEAKGIVEAADGFAQVFPEHKYRIVELMQEKGHIVGMTGDGVNDAPALKKADAGVAVAGATDAAKSAADVVLTKPGLSVIIDAIKESRKIFERMTNYAVYRIAETTRVLIFLSLAILAFNFYPLTAVMIVILALLNDIPIMAIAYDNVKVQEKPVHWNMRGVLIVASLLGATGVVSSFGLFLIGLEIFHLSAGTLQTLIFLKMAVAGHLTIYLARTGVNHFWKRPLPASILFVATEITQVVGTLFAVYGVFMAPIGWGFAAFIWGYAFLSFLITDQLKIHFFRLMGHEEAVENHRHHHDTPTPHGSIQNISFQRG